MSRLQVVIIDDNASIRGMLRRLVENINGKVIGEAEDGRAGINAAERLRPDLLLLDISMPGMSGFDVARELHESMPQLAVIFVTQHASQAYVDEAFRCGAKGYVLKRAVAGELFDAVQTAMRGDVFCSLGLS